MKGFYCLPTNSGGESIIQAKTACNSDRNCIGFVTDLNGGVRMCMNSSQIFRDVGESLSFHMKNSDLGSFHSIFCFHSQVFILIF